MTDKPFIVKTIQGVEEWVESALKRGKELRPLFNGILPSFALIVGVSMGLRWVNTSKQKSAGLIHRFMFTMCVLLELCGSPGLGISFLLGLGLGVVGQELGASPFNPQLDL